MAGGQTGRTAILKRGFHLSVQDPERLEQQPGQSLIAHASHPPRRWVDRQASLLLLAFRGGADLRFRSISAPSVGSSSVEIRTVRPDEYEEAGRVTRLA